MASIDCIILPRASSRKAVVKSLSAFAGFSRNCFSAKENQEPQHNNNRNPAIFEESKVTAYCINFYLNHHFACVVGNNRMK